MKKRTLAKLAFLLVLCTLLSLITSCSPITTGRGQSGVSAGDSFGILYSLDDVEAKNSVKLVRLEDVTSPYEQTVGSRLYFYEYDALADRTVLAVYDTEKGGDALLLEQEGKASYRAFENGCFAIASKGACTVYDREGKTTLLPYEINDLETDISVQADLLSVTGEDVAYRLEEKGTVSAPFTLRLEVRDDYTYQTDNYYYVFSDDSVTVYDRYLMPAYYYELPADAVHGNIFYLTNDTIVVQYSYALPISEVDYDYMEGSSKYRQYTTLIPVLTGKPKAIETNFLFDNLIPTDGADEEMAEGLSSIGVRIGSMAALAIAREIVDAHLSEKKFYAVNASLGIVANLQGFFNVPTGMPYAVTDTYFTVTVPLFNCMYFLDKNGGNFLTLSLDDDILAMTSSYIVTEDTVYSAEDGSTLYRLTELDREAGIAFCASVSDELLYTSEKGDVYRFTCPEKADETGVRTGAITERVIDAELYGYSFDSCEYGFYTVYVKADGSTRLYAADGTLLLESVDEPMIVSRWNDGALLAREITENGKTANVYYILSFETAEK